MSLSIAKATPRVCADPNYADFDAEALCALFISTANGIEPMQRRLGKIYYHLEAKLGRLEFKPGAEQRFGPSARKMLSERGATRGVIQSAMYGARAWALVAGGKLKKEEFEKLTIRECVALARSQSYRPRPELRQNLAPNLGYKTSPLVEKITGMPRSVPVRDLPVPEKPKDREEAEKSVAALTVALAEAQRDLLVARTHLARRMPPEWDNLISNSLTPLGRLRFALQEWIKAHPDAENEVGLMGIETEFSAFGLKA